MKKVRIVVKKEAADLLLWGFFIFFITVLLLGLMAYNNSRMYVVYKTTTGQIVRVLDPHGKEIQSLPKDAIAETIWVSPDYK